VPTQNIDAESRLLRLQKFLEADHQNQKIRSDIFDLALSTGSWNIAQEQLDYIGSNKSYDFSWTHRLALLHIARQEWQDATTTLQSLISQGENDPILFYNLAYVEFAQGNYSIAQTQLEPLLSQNPSNLSDALALLLQCLHQQGLINEAMTLFTTYENRIHSPHAFGIASLIAIDSNNLSIAKKWAKQALETDPGQREATVAMGSIALSERDVQTAFSLLEKARIQHPHDGRTLSTLGMAYLLALDLTQASEAFGQALKFMPNHIGTWHGLGWCEMMRKNLSAAYNAFEQALQLDRNFAESHGGLAVVLALQGDKEKAILSIDRALGLDSKCLSARYAQALLSGEAGNTKSFMALAQRILGSHRTSTGVSLADIVLK